MSSRYRSGARTERTIILSKRDLHEVRRLLALLAGSEVQRLEDAQFDSKSDSGEIAEELSREALKARALEMLLNRRRRERMLNKAMFSDLAWDLLLTLYVYEGSSARFTVGRLSDYLDMPKTSSLRWIDYLRKEQLVVRREHPNDQRTSFVEISPTGRSILDSYFLEILNKREAENAPDADSDPASP